ncbi:hypothetical protein BDB00DRAFT_926145 [Zychaea mexicana]|uniref:uncharacterized protein n=1 Tax=Zychaea mexicana TaxID=64656 RepID=UPI0022FDF0B9|nr:uncharacterized protein BDB00DRAFT_926145 [Zychaea mexicana]KAI9497287.1 hypothetical protein BDB00DRAFT_926145 [Zychaea mexicana]
MGKTVINVGIVGGGLGGLATAIALRRAGHNVTVYEGAKELSEVGAGIQVPPNTSRLLDAWGLFDRFKQKVVWPANINMRRYNTGEVIGPTPLKPKMIELYGYPYWLIHRADYQQLLYDAAVETGATVILDARVLSVNEADTTVSLESGKIDKFDLIIGADGIRSAVRLAVMPDEEVLPRVSTNCAYRATVPSALMRADPEVAFLMDDPNSNCWIGYRRHIMAYPIRNGELYNLVMSHPGAAAVGRWNEPGNLEEMKKHYHNFDPIIRKVLEKVTGCLKWTLADLPVLSNWVSSSGRIVLIGDAAHAMLPYLAQGAAQAVEDGATLGELLTDLQSVDEIPALMALYEKMRRPRAEVIQKGAYENGDIWHMPDGDMQIQRDLGMKGQLPAGAKNPNQWGDGNFQPWLFGHNAITEARRRLAEFRNGSDIATDSARL